MKINEPCWAVVDKSDGHVADYFISEAVGLETIRKMGFEVEDYTIVPVTIVPTAEIERLRACERVLREMTAALECLRDHQNGSPLPKYERGWKDAMDRSQVAIDKSNALAAALGSEAK